MTSGMKPPCSRPNSARQARKEVLPESLNCDAATIDQSTICAGIQRSGPTHLDTSCDGSSAQRNASLKTELPKL